MQELLTLLIGLVALNREKDFSIVIKRKNSKPSSLIGKLIAVLNMTSNLTALNIAEVHLKSKHKFNWTRLPQLLLWLGLLFVDQGVQTMQTDYFDVKL